jgi:uncharacterized repeat protein (TIGR01451 family)
MRLRVAPVAVIAAVAAALATGSLPAAAGITMDLAIQKSHAGNFTVGQNGTFTITLTNTAGNPTDGVIITIHDTLPTGLTYQSFTAGTTGMACSAVGQVVTCTGTPNVSVGTPKSLTITVAVGAAAVPSVSNTAFITNNCGCDSNPANDTSTDAVTVNAVPSPSPSPSPSPTAVALPATGTGTGTGPGSAAPVALFGFLAVIVVGGMAVLVRTRAGRPRN